jgi:hypothetical protein
MRTHGTIVPTPSFGDHLRFAAAAKPFQAQALIAEAAVKAFIRAVLPWLAWVDQARVPTPAVSSHSRMALLTNSEPLSAAHNEVHRVR